MADGRGDLLEEYKNLLRNREFGSSAWLDDLFKKNRLLAEMQAQEACDWLKETGFPQYAHMYQDGQMPIALEVAKRDHAFLDDISLRSLFCRLEILNKCFSLNITPLSEVKLRSRSRKSDSTAGYHHQQQQHQQHQQHHHHHNNSSSNSNSSRHLDPGAPDDEGVEVALSQRWTYEPHSHRWSRSCENDSSSTRSPTGFDFKKETDFEDQDEEEVEEEEEDEEEEEEEGAEVEKTGSDEESNISEVEGSGFESSDDQRAKDFEEMEDDETLKRRKREKNHKKEKEEEEEEEGRLENSKGDLNFMEKIDRMLSSPSSSSSSSSPQAKEKPRVQRVLSHNDAFQLESLEEYFEPDYRDIFDSLADLSRSLFEEQEIQSTEADDKTMEREKRAKSAEDGTTIGQPDVAANRNARPTEAEVRADGQRFRREAEMSEMTSSFSSSTLSTRSSHSSLSMASYTLGANQQQEDSKRPHPPSNNYHHQHHLPPASSSRAKHAQFQQKLGKQRQEDSKKQQQQQQQQQHQNLVMTLSSRSENSYLFNRLTNDAVVSPPRSSVVEEEIFPDEWADGMSALPSESRKRSTTYASRDSFTPSECTLASGYCFPRTPRHRQPTPPSPLLTRAADKIRGAFSFLKKIDNSGFARRSLRMKKSPKVGGSGSCAAEEDAQHDFIGGLVRSDLFPSTPVASHQWKDILHRQQQQQQQQQLQQQQQQQREKVEVLHPVTEGVKTQVEFGKRRRTQRAKNFKDGDCETEAKMAAKSFPRKMSTYDNVCNTQDFDKILDDLYSNIFLLDQSLLVQVDESSKSTTGSSTTASSGNESQGRCNFTSDESKDLSKTFPQSSAEATECDTLKSKGSRAKAQSPEVFKRDDDHDDDEEDDAAATTDDDDDGGDDSDKRWRYPDAGERERRDSGVGSSLTRRPSNRRTVRWQSFLKNGSTSSSAVVIPDLSRLSAQQMLILEKYCLLRITSILEKYGSISRKSWKNLIHRKPKTVNPSDYPVRAVFGVPLEVLKIRHGQALPRCVLLAMKKLRRSIDDCDGIFRKAGAKVRVQALKSAVVSDPESIDYEESSVHDLADLLKAFLKELPECLFTSKFSKILTNIFKNVPKELQAESVQACLVLMPNEHRECLHTFMLFCHHLSNHAHVTQMNASNLALCLSPSFFHLETNPPAALGPSSSSNSSRKQQAAYRKCIDEQKFVQLCLTFVIENAPFLFSNFQAFFDGCQIVPSGGSGGLAGLGYLTLRENMDRQFNASLCSQRLRVLFQFVWKEAKPNSKGWSFPTTISSTSLIPPPPPPPTTTTTTAKTTSTPSSQSQFSSSSSSSSPPPPPPSNSTPPMPEMFVEVSYKKRRQHQNHQSHQSHQNHQHQADRHPLRLWRATMVIEAPPVEVLTRILWDRHLWDYDLLKWRRAERMDANTEVFQYVLNSMAPHPPRLYSELRSWKVDVKTGRCTLVCQSVDCHPRTNAGSTVSAEVQSCHYHIEPCGSGRCRLTLISRVDFKGTSMAWYNYMYDYMVAAQLMRIALTLKSSLLSSCHLPETKV